MFYCFILFWWFRSPVVSHNPLDQLCCSLSFHPFFPMGAPRWRSLMTHTTTTSSTMLLSNRRNMERLHQVLNFYELLYRVDLSIYWKCLRQYMAGKWRWRWYMAMQLGIFPRQALIQYNIFCHILKANRGSYLQDLWAQGCVVHKSLGYRFR